MKIALVYRTFALTGGTERFGIDLARALVAAGDEVHLVGQHLAAPVDGAAFHRVGVPPLGRTGRLLWFAHQSARALARLAAEGGPFDAVLGLGRTLEQDVLRLGGGCHRAYLEAVEGWRDGRPPSPLGLEPYHRMLLELERRQLSLTRTRRIIAVSRRVKEELLSHYPVPGEAIEVIHNGVDLDRFDPDRQPGPRTLREARGIPPDAFVVLFVGNGLKRKGFDTLLEAFPRFASTARSQGFSPPIYLLVVSRDAQRRSSSLAPLQRQLARHRASLDLAGGQAHIEPFYRMADLLALPTRYDPFANVCLEALAMGLPVITTRVNGASEVLREEAETLCLEDPDDADGLTAALLGLLDLERRARLGALGRRIAAERSSQRNARDIRALLEASRRT